MAFAPSSLILANNFLPLNEALYCMKNLAIAFTLVTFSTSTFACFGGPDQDLIILGIRLLALNTFLVFLSLTLRCIANFRDVFKSVTIICASLALPIFMYFNTHGSGDCGEGDVVAFKVASIILCLVVAYELINLFKVRRKLQYNKLFKRDK